MTLSIRHSIRIFTSSYGFFFAADVSALCNDIQNFTEHKLHIMMDVDYSPTYRHQDSNTIYVTGHSLAHFFMLYETKYLSTYVFSPKITFHVVNNPFEEGINLSYDEGECHV